MQGKTAGAKEFLLPDSDMEEQMRERIMFPLFALESGDYIKDFLI